MGEAGHDDGKLLPSWRVESLKEDGLKNPGIVLPEDR